MEGYWVVQWSTEQQHPPSVAGVGAGAVSAMQALSLTSPPQPEQGPSQGSSPKPKSHWGGFHLLSGD